MDMLVVNIKKNLFGGDGADIIQSNYVSGYVSCYINKNIFIYIY